MENSDDILMKAMGIISGSPALTGRFKNIFTNLDRKKQERVRLGIMYLHERLQKPPIPTAAPFREREEIPQDEVQRQPLPPSPARRPMQRMTQSEGGSPIEKTDIVDEQQRRRAWETTEGGTEGERRRLPDSPYVMAYKKRDLKDLHGNDSNFLTITWEGRKRIKDRTGDKRRIPRYEITLGAYRKEDLENYSAVQFNLGRIEEARGKVRDDFIRLFTRNRLFEEALKPPNEKIYNVKMYTSKNNEVLYKILKKGKIIREDYTIGQLNELVDDREEIPPPSPLSATEENIEATREERGEPSGATAEDRPGAVLPPLVEEGEGSPAALLEEARQEGA